jgi:urease accessory protein
MTVNAPLRQEEFAANRATGRLACTIVATPGGSRRSGVHEAGSLRLRFPNGERGGALEAVMVNTAGGLAGGDRFDIDISVGGDARLTATTAAAEKIYRSLGPATEIGIKLQVHAGGALAWLPQETILFDRMRLRRTINVDLAGDSSLMLAEAVVFGRSAMGETVTSGDFFDCWRVRVGGTLAFAETLRLEGAIAQQLAQRTSANGGVAVASVLKFPGDDASIASVRAIETNCAGEVGVSAWNGLALARLVAPDGATLHRDLIGVIIALGGVKLPRLWLN